MTTKRNGRVTGRRRSGLLMMFSLAMMSMGRTANGAPSEIVARSSTRHEETLESSLGKGQSEEVGNPSDLAWQAWLLVDGNAKGQSSGILDSASLLRRITPKSIFIAPALTACAEGYQADTMNRCVKDVSINSQAHRGFLVERLNALFANAGKSQFPQASSSSSSSSSSSMPTGPLQLNIPLLMSPSSKPTRESPEIEHPAAARSPHDDETSNPVVPQRPAFKRENTSEGAVVTVYKLGDSLKNEDGFPANKSTVDESKIVSSSEEPIVGTIRDSIDNLPSLVDYEIPLELSGPNDSSLITDRYEKNRDDVISDVSPTLVLLLTPTKLTSSSGSNDVPESTGPVMINVENNTATGQEIGLIENLPQTTKEPDLLETTTINDTSHEATSGEPSNVEGTYDRGPGEDESTEIYDEETYDESTEFDDEILKHSEAGLTVTPANIEDKSSTAPTTSTLFPRGSNSSDNEPKESVSEITSEVTVNSDFVRETTLVDFHPDETKYTIPATTLSPLALDHRRTTIVLPVVSKELELPEVGAFSFVNSKNEKRNDHASNRHELPGSSERIIVADSGKDRNENSQKNFSQKNSSNESPSKIFHRDDTRRNENSNATSINDKLAPSSNETSAEMEDRKDDSIHPVRGIEEALEDSLPADLASRSDSAETMMAASTNVAGTIVSPHESDFFSNDDKRDEISVRFVEDVANTKPPKAILDQPSDRIRPETIYDYEIPSRDPLTLHRQDPRDDAPPIIRTIDEDRYRPNVDYEFSSSSDHFFPFSSQRDANYVRFPNYEIQRDEPMSSRVRFPSDEANSISNEYKERNRRPYANRQIYRAGENNGAGNLLAEASRKESYRWSSNEWRNNPFPQRSNHADQRSRAPMLLKFWTRMPLVRDPSLGYPSRGNSEEQRRRRIDLPIEARRTNHYDDSSSHQVAGNFQSKSMMIG